MPSVEFCNAFLAEAFCRRSDSIEIVEAAFPFPSFSLERYSGPSLSTLPPSPVLFLRPPPLPPEKSTTFSWSPARARFVPFHDKASLLPPIKLGCLLFPEKGLREQRSSGFGYPLAI